jgi:hypothetical protein
VIWHATESDRVALNPFSLKFLNLLVQTYLGLEPLAILRFLYLLSIGEISLFSPVAISVISLGYIDL